MSKLLIVGAGGLGCVVGEVARELARYEAVDFLDDAVRADNIVGKCVDYTALAEEYDEAIAAFGDNGMRLMWTHRLEKAGYIIPSIVHPSAFVSSSAILGAGCIILHKAIVSSNTILGKACLI
ncbi:MAG: mucin-desulfating sulfatase, partial [Oscillospiraceae bacterium]